MTTELPPIPRLARLLVLLVSLAVLGSAVVLAGLAVGGPLIQADQKPSWALFGFEVVVAVAAVLGVLTGRGRFRDGPGLALACIAGTILVASGLGWQGAGRQLLGVSLLPVLGGRALAALTLGAVGAWCVLSRESRAWRIAFLGAVLVSPVMLGAAASLHPTGRALLERAMGSSPATQFMTAVGGYALVTVLLSAGTHLIITAFERGRPGPTSGPA